VSALPGFGNTIDFDLNLVVPDQSKSLDDGAIEPWTKPRYRVLFQEAKNGRAAAEFDERAVAATHRRTAPLDSRGRSENEYEGSKVFSICWSARNTSYMSAFS